MDVENGGWTVVLGYFAAVNLAGLALMYLDKRRASSRRRRISERILLSLALVGAAPGMYVAMVRRRHKTHKPAFRIGLPLLSILYLFVLLWWIYRLLVPAT